MLRRRFRRVPTSGLLFFFRVGVGRKEGHLSVGFLSGEGRKKRRVLEGSFFLGQKKVTFRRGSFPSSPLFPLPPPSRRVSLLVVGVPNDKKHKKYNKHIQKKTNEKNKHRTRNTPKTHKNTRKLPVCKRKKCASVCGFWFFQR